MTDNTRDEKHTAADFANAEFARHLGGRVAHRSCPDTWQTTAANEPWTTWWNADSDMARDGWSPVRECPDPEQHDNETTHPGGLSASEWKILAVAYGREMDSAREHAEETGEFAALWKETARELFKARKRWRGIAMQAERERDYAYQRNGYHVQRAEKAERERDEAREELADLRRRYNEQGDALVASYTEPHPLTPDAINARVERAEDAFYRARRENRPDALRLAVLAALTEPPARPEGAETLAFDLDEAHKGGGDVQDEADRLYAMGYRKAES